MIICEKKTPRRLCEAVEEFASRDAGKMARRPFNRFVPIVTSWWLVPSPELPFYRHGKIYFDWGDRDHSTIAGGFYLEKGLAPEVAAVYNSKKGRALIMDDRWEWPDFLRRCASGETATMLQDTVRQSGLELELHARGGYVDDPNLFDPYNDKLKRDHFIFRLHDDGTLEYRSAQRDAMVLKIFNRVKNLRDFAAAAAKLQEDHFLWFNLFVAAKFGVCPEELPVGAEVWPAERIWNDFLRHFQPWLR
ncbi:MAG: hypothetical protein PHQ27_02835 [Victivallales bacterium]|nr:hypothetical protein [Victivallales bacterium]